PDSWPASAGRIECFAKVFPSRPHWSNTQRQQYGSGIWPINLSFDLAHYNDRKREVARLGRQHPIMIALFHYAGGGRALGRSLQGEDRRVRCSRSFTAGGEKHVECRLGGGIGIFRDRGQQAEVSLRRGALMGSIHGEIAVSNGVDAGRDHLPAAGRALSPETPGGPKRFPLGTECDAGNGGP